MKNIIQSVIEQKVLYLYAIILAVIVYIINLQNNITDFYYYVNQCLYWGSVPDVYLIMFIALLPVIIGMIVASGFMTADIEIAATYIFPRTGNLLKWYLQKNITLFIQALLYASLFIVSLCILFFVFNTNKTEQISGISFIKIYISYVLFTYIAFVFANCISLLIMPKWAVVLFNIIIVLCCISAKESVNNVIAKHLNILNYFFIYWNVVSMLSTIVYYFFIMIICLYLGYKALNINIYKGRFYRYE